MFILPSDVRCIIWKKVWFLNVRDRLAVRLLSRPQPVWQGTASEGTQVDIIIPGGKCMKLTQRDSSWYDLYCVRRIDHRFTCVLHVRHDRVELWLSEFQGCHWCAIFHSNQWYEYFNDGKT